MNQGTFPDLTWPGAKTLAKSGVYSSMEKSEVSIGLPSTENVML